MDPFGLSSLPGLIFRTLFLRLLFRYWRLWLAVAFVALVAVKSYLLGVDDGARSARAAETSRRSVQPRAQPRPSATHSAASFASPAAVRRESPSFLASGTELAASSTEPARTEAPKKRIPLRPPRQSQTTGGVE